MSEVSIVYQRLRKCVIIYKLEAITMSMSNPDVQETFEENVLQDVPGLDAEHR